MFNTLREDTHWYPEFQVQDDVGKEPFPEFPTAIAWKGSGQCVNHGSVERQRFIRPGILTTFTKNWRNRLHFTLLMSKIMLYLFYYDKNS